MSEQRLRDFTALCTDYYRDRNDCELTKNFISDMGEYAYKLKEAKKNQIQFEFFRYRFQAGVCIQDTHLNEIEKTLMDILRSSSGSSRSQLRPRIQMVDMTRFFQELNDLRLRIPATEPRTVTKVVKGTPEYDQANLRIHDKEVTGINVGNDHWVIEPALDDLEDRVHRLINPGMIVENVQEIVDNILARHVARSTNQPLPPKAILPSLIEDTCPQVTKINIQTYRRDFNDRAKRGEVFCFKDSDEACWVTEPYNSYVGRKLQSRTRSSTSQQKAQELVEDIYANMLRKGKEYSDYKLSLTP